MTHEELLAKINEPNYLHTILDKQKALRAVVEYAKTLSETDYRGNPPVEHYIAKKLYSIIEKELG